MSCFAQRDFISLETDVILDTLHKYNTIKLKSLIAKETIGYFSGLYSNDLAQINIFSDSTITIKNLKLNRETLAYGQFKCSNLRLLKEGKFIITKGYNFTNDTIEISNYLNNKKHGNYYVYHSGNRIAVKAFFKENHPNGSIYIYDTLGGINTLGNYKNGLRNGFWTYYYQNGEVKARGKYSQTDYIDTVFKSKNCPCENAFDYMVTSMPKKTGSWIYFDENGEKIYKEKYNKSGLLKKIRLIKNFYNFKFLNDNHLETPNW